MKIYCQKDDLLKGLQVVSRALPATTAIPELTHFYFKAKEGVLSVCATNMKTYISTIIPAEILREGEILVQGKFFLELVQSLNSFGNKHAVVDVNEENNRVLFTLEGERLKYELTGRGREEYPEVELIEAETEFKIDGKMLKDLFKFGSIASAATETSVQGFRGVCMEIKDSKLTIASMDGNRLAMISRILPRFEGMSFRWLLSLEVVSELLKILPDEEVLVQQRDNKVLLRFSNIIFQTMLSEGDFVDYEDFIPDDLEGGIELSRTEFLSNLKGLQPVSRESGDRIAIDISEDVFGLSSFNEKFGEAYREIKIEGSNEEMNLAFNARYIIDFLNSSSDQTILMQCDGEGMPAYFWSKENIQEASDLCVIMSLTVQ
ncbi:MAG: DNA polymerase III subunit beta [Candidatus Cloacimonadota bacterium]|nr:MAG: DNA polymerase III subunit beta [Candidatus Cloacimonadota bacterium]